MTLDLWTLIKGRDDIRCGIVVEEAPDGERHHEVHITFNGSRFHDRIFESNDEAGAYAAEFLADYLSRGWQLVPSEVAIH